MDSSMGMTPLEGLVMGTRSGDVDPGAFGYLHRRLGLGIEEIEAGAAPRQRAEGADRRLGHARCGTPRRGKGDAEAQLAINIYAYRARKYIGAYAAAMGGLDAVVFTGGIGENSASMRRRICDGLEFMGLRLDYDRNHAVDLATARRRRSRPMNRACAVIVTETAEQLMIAREVAAALERPAPEAAPDPRRGVGPACASLGRGGRGALFGPGYELTPAQAAAPAGQLGCAKSASPSRAQAGGWKTSPSWAPSGAAPRSRCRAPTASRWASTRRCAKAASWTARRG
jgi:acetate kinase